MTANLPDNCPPAASHTCDECNRVVPRCPHCGDAIGHALRPCPVCNPSNKADLPDADRKLAEDIGWRSLVASAVMAPSAVIVEALAEYAEIRSLQIRDAAAQTARAEGWDRHSEAVRSYCEFSAGLAEEIPSNPYAVGLARAYRDLLLHSIRPFPPQELAALEDQS